MPSLLKIFVNPNAPAGLKEQYQRTVMEHNNKINTDPNPDSGFDMFIPEDQKFISNQTIFININIKAVLFSEDGKCLPFYIYPRSSIATKTPLRLANSVGIIDCGYRGNLGCVLDCRDSWLVTKEEDAKEEFILGKFSRVTQICAGDLSPFNVELVDSEEELGTTTRGSGGFGSTDKSSNIQFTVS